jgi:hypothetical protein
MDNIKKHHKLMGKKRLYGFVWLSRERVAVPHEYANKYYVFLKAPGML